MDFETPQIKALSDKMEWDEDNGLLYFFNADDRKRRKNPRVFVPQQLRQTLLQGAHRSPMAGHPGHLRMYQSLSKKFWWENMTKDVKRMVNGCPNCEQAKAKRRLGQGYVCTYKLVEEPFRVWNVDHVGPLPKNQGGFRYILVAVCRGSNYMVTIPTVTTAGQETAEALWDHVFCKYGVPERVVTDRGTAFKNELITEMARRSGFYWNYVSALTRRQTARWRGTIRL